MEIGIAGYVAVKALFKLLVQVKADSPLYLVGGFVKFALDSLVLRVGAAEIPNQFVNIRVLIENNSHVFVHIRSPFLFGILVYYTTIKSYVKGLEDFMSHFSERLRLLRQENRYKQREMADILGLKLRGYQEYEYGNAYPTVPGLIQIAEFFQVSTDYLLGRTDIREVSR